jgi:PHS family inorganic phosphate transporter-like MFS transporter
MHKLYAPNGYGAVDPLEANDYGHGSDYLGNNEPQSVSSTQYSDGSDFQNYYVPLKDCKNDAFPSNEAIVKADLRRAMKTTSDAMMFWLGFYKNPVVASSASIASQDCSSTSNGERKAICRPSAHPVLSSKRNSSYADMRLSMVSNFSAAYNTVNISLALTLMKAVHPPLHPSEISLCSSALIAGMIIGQLAGGLLGDWLGRHMAMSVVMTLQVASAFWSAWVGLLDVGLGVYHMLAVCRFLLGLGCGGVYPLAATLTAEASSQHENKGKLVALVFSLQGVGYLCVSLTAYALVWIFGDKSDLAWRLLLGFGCVPGLLLIMIRTFFRSSASRKEPMNDSESGGAETTSIDTKQSDSDKSRAHKLVRLPPEYLFQQIKNEPNLLYKILGTAGCWLLFDILFYGNTLFQPIVFAAAFGESETVLAIVRDSTLISLIGLPGYFVSVYMVGLQSPKMIQLQGFFVMALLYAIIGLKFSDLAMNRFALMTMYGLTFFFSNYGPNTTVSNLVVHHFQV